MAAITASLGASGPSAAAARTDSWLRWTLSDVMRISPPLRRCVGNVLQWELPAGCIAYGGGPRGPRQPGVHPAVQTALLTLLVVGNLRAPDLVGESPDQRCRRQASWNSPSESTDNP